MGVGAYLIHSNPLREFQNERIGITIPQNQRVLANGIGRNYSPVKSILKRPGSGASSKLAGYDNAQPDSSSKGYFHLNGGSGPSLPPTMAHHAITRGRNNGDGGFQQTPDEVIGV